MTSHSKNKANVRKPALSETMRRSGPCALKIRPWFPVTHLRTTKLHFAASRVLGSWSRRRHSRHSGRRNHPRALPGEENRASRAETRRETTVGTQQRLARPPRRQV